MPAPPIITRRIEQGSINLQVHNMKCCPILTRTYPQFLIFKSADLQKRAVSTLHVQVRVAGEGQTLSIFAGRRPATMNSTSSPSMKSTLTPKASAMLLSVTLLYESRNCTMASISSACLPCHMKPWQG